MKKFRHAKEGFSLVEVIIAVALLALLSIPILNYFTNAALSSSRGKDTHRASIVAQSVAEELNACESFDQIETMLEGEDGSDWSVEKEYDTTTKETQLVKKVSEDGVDYEAEVTLDYDYGASEGAKYNGYAVPELKEVYSDQNVVISETDQAETAVSEFLYQFSGSASAVASGDAKSDTIRENMGREIHISVEKDKAASDVYDVRGYYHYTYKGKSYETDVESTKIEADKLKNIYFFYNLQQDDKPETVNVYISNEISIDAAKKISIYMICQKKVKAPQENYRLSIQTADPAPNQAGFACYFTNVTKVDGVEVNMVPDPADSSKKVFVGDNASDFIGTDKSGKRIAKITVDVYPSGEAHTESDRLVRVETSKGE